MKIKVLTAKEGAIANALYKARIQEAESSFERIWRKEIDESKKFNMCRHSPGEKKKRKASYMEACRIRWIVEDDLHNNAVSRR